MNFNDLTLDIAQELMVKAAPGDVFRSLLKGLAGEMSTPDGKSMALVLEAWPGGRWFRDLGDQQGHLWGFVQVIKPPTLLEITGPLMMSYASANHVQFRLTQVSGGTTLAFRHRAFGLIDEQHRTGMPKGWDHILKTIKDSSEK